MQLPLQVTFRNMPPSDAVRDDILERVNKLESFSNQILSCQVILSIPHKHHHKGRIPHIQIRLHVPGQVLVISRERERDGAHEDIYVALADTFKALNRKLEDYSRVKRRDVKEKVGPPHGFVSSMFPDLDYGFVTTPDGREIFFHRNSLLNGDFKKLKIGTEVSFSEGQGEKGPTVTTMKIIGKEGHHLGFTVVHQEKLM